MTKQLNQTGFVDWFRQASPYIHAHRGSTFVLGFGGEAVSDPDFAELIHDIALLHGLGVRVVLVHGSRPQIEERLRLRGASIQLVNGLRITDSAALACVKEAAGAVRVDIEAVLSMGLANTPMAGVRIRVDSGNYVSARPLGVINGVDYQHTGEVRRVDAQAIRQRLDSGAIVLIPPIGYSVTGEVFNLSASDLAAAVAQALGADKLIYLMEDSLRDARKRLIGHCTPRELEGLLSRRKKLDEGVARVLQLAADACRGGVKRCHLLPRSLPDALLLELFTREGVGTLVSAEAYESIRKARLEDVGGILELISPLEEAGVLVRRSRELLETEVGFFSVVERDGVIIGCGALYTFPDEKMAEVACLAVHPDYRNSGRGDALLQHLEQQARSQGLKRIFVLTTRTAHWFLERGFQAARVAELPMPKQQLYNWQRQSKVFLKRL